MTHFLELSTSKIVAIATVWASVAGEIFLSVRAIIADAPTQGWEHIGVIGIGGLAIVWLLRERENDKKDHKEKMEAEKAEHKAQVASLLADLKAEQQGTRHFMENVVAANTKALQINSAATDNQNQFFETVTKRVLSDAFSGGAEADLPALPRKSKLPTAPLRTRDE